MPNILAINPWIYDFAAYDYWIKPYGFLQILELLKLGGFNVEFIDLLDRHHPNLKNNYVKDKYYGTGKFYTEEVPKPKILNWVPRKYKRYGLPVKILRNFLSNIHPDLILVTSSMTYWYPGVVEVINICRDFFPNIPIFLGGTYPTLCYEHAKKTTGADYVIKSNEIRKFNHYFKQATGIEINISENTLKKTLPSYEYYSNPLYAVVRTSWGCPFNCSYCASNRLSPQKIEYVEPERIAEYLYMLNKREIENFVFYDDALLYNQKHILNILKEILTKDIKANFHTPNGLHARFLNQEIAVLFKKTNFVNPRLSLETLDKKLPNFTNEKVNFKDLQTAISNLRKAGYKKGEYSVYLLLGIPGENLKTIKDTLFLIHNLGAHIYLTEFSPIPHTPIWQTLNINKQEPLFQNNSIFPLYELRDWNRLQTLKDLSRNLNRKL